MFTDPRRVRVNLESVNSKRRSRPAMLLATLVLALLTSCVEFEEQTMSYRYDPAADTLRIFQDYHGIHALNAAANKEERDQLDSVISGQRTFFFNNWITEFNREEVLETLAKLRDPLRRAELKLPEPAWPRLDKFLCLLRDNVRVENGPFYLDARRQLCGAQYVTVTNVSAVLAAGNDLALTLVRAWVAEEGASPENRAARLKFTAKSSLIVELDGNALTLRLPLGAADFEKQFGAAAEDRQFMEDVRNAGVRVAFADDVVTLRFGDKTNSISILTLPCKASAFSPNLVELARAKHTVRESFATRDAAREFLLNGRATDVGKKRE